LVRPLLISDRDMDEVDIEEGGIEDGVDMVIGDVDRIGEVLEQMVRKTAPDRRIRLHSSKWKYSFESLLCLWISILCY
jgi:hypothetical protein